MPKVKFKFDKEKDLWNIWDKVNGKSSFGDNWENSISKKLFEICRGKKLSECKKELSKANEKFYNTEITSVFISSLKKLWSKREKFFYKRLEKITGKPLDFNSTCYITTISICPYSAEDSWFMCCVFSGLTGALSTVAHELMHLHFHKYYFKKIEKEIGSKKTQDLKEALTVLLNLEFFDLIFSRDRGYPNHVGLRKFISEEWKKEKDFDKLLKKCVIKLKTERVK